MKQFFSELLWNFLVAAFPRAKFMLCSATVTEKALRSIRGGHISVFNKPKFLCDC